MVVGATDGAEVDGCTDVCIVDGFSVRVAEGIEDGFIVDGRNDGEFELTKDGRPDVCVNVGGKEGVDDGDDDGLLEGTLDGRIDGVLVDVIDATIEGKQVGIEVGLEVGSTVGYMVGSSVG